MVDIQTILLAIFIDVIYMLFTGGEWKNEQNRKKNVWRHGRAH